MATRSITYKPAVDFPALTKSYTRKFAELFKRLLPRPRTILSVGLLLTGLGIPFLMAIKLIPASFLLGFVGLAFMIIGGVLSLFYIGNY